MNAVRVVKKSGHTWHWLLDPERTYCGKKPHEMDVVVSEEREALPQTEACHGCLRAVENWDIGKPRERAERYVLPSAPGKLRKTGSLNHGLRPRSGRKLQ